MESELEVSSMAKMLSAPGEEKAQILRVSLHDIKIRADGGDWATVFEHLRERCPDLELCFAYQLAYLNGHPNYISNNRAWDNLSRNWEAGETDSEEFGALLGSLISKAGGPDHYPWRKGLHC